MDLKVEEFIKLRNIIYNKAGIFFEPKKIYFVKKRVEKRMSALSINDVSEYNNYLSFKDKDGKELQELLNLLTTNETYFFREVNQLEIFVNYCLPEVMERKKNKFNKKIRIWSAGCSSGEEPYTIAIMLLEKFKDKIDDNFEIIATDIDTEILKKAENALYNERSVRNVSDDLLRKYFVKTPDGYQLRMIVKKMVNFKYLNLFDNEKMRMMRGMDFIFCRNVLIYFNDNSRKEVVANFYDSLNPGGFIYLGFSESVSRINSAFKIKKLGGGIVHQKPEI